MTVDVKDGAGVDGSWRHFKTYKKKENKMVRYGPCLWTSYDKLLRTEEYVAREYIVHGWSKHEGFHKHVDTPK